jgi:hypothetical protein
MHDSNACEEKKKDKMQWKRCDLGDPLIRGNLKPNRKKERKNGISFSYAQPKEN